MFELFSGEHRRVPHRDTVPLVISTAVHVVVIGAMAAIPLLYLSADLPEVPQMLAFVAAAPPPPPPPPPPPAAAKAARVQSRSRFRRRSRVLYPSSRRWRSRPKVV